MDERESKIGDERKERMQEFRSVKDGVWPAMEERGRIVERD
jgi:hypothetical protein